METRVMEISGIRHELVSHVRQQILAGTYDTMDKLEAAMDRLFAHMADD